MATGSLVGYGEPEGCNQLNNVTFVKKVTGLALNKEFGIFEGRQRCCFVDMLSYQSSFNELSSLASKHQFLMHEDGT